VTQKIYFPNLNGICFIAAFLVIIHHIEQLKSLAGYPNLWDSKFIRISGKLGVILFFVLSGFLITYLLLAEKKQTGTISIKDFYLRRILRIWPLYYIVVFAGFFVLAKLDFLQVGNLSGELYTNFNTKFLLFLFFLPNLALVMFPAVPFVSQSWSVGVEEQYYLLWPWLVRKYSNIKKMLRNIIFLYITVRILLIVTEKLILPGSEIIEIISGFTGTFSIDCMAIGGIGAYYLFIEDMKFLPFVFKQWVQISTVSLTLILLLVGFKFPEFYFEFYAVLFAIIIVNLAGNKECIFSLENPVLNYLGKISYGLYMYHALCIVITIKILAAFNIYNSIGVFVFSFITTILFATASYEFIETWFLKRKVRFSKIISGDNANMEQECITQPAPRTPAVVLTTKNYKENKTSQQ